MDSKYYFDDQFLSEEFKIKECQKYAAKLMSLGEDETFNLYCDICGHADYFKLSELKSIILVMHQKELNWKDAYDICFPEQ